MSRDILDILKVKEGEMDALIEAAHSEASGMREEAALKATALKAEKELAVSKELTRIEAEALKAMEEEIKSVAGKAENEARALREMAEEKRRQAIDGISEILLEG